MSTLKTRENDASVDAFIRAAADREQKLLDSFELVRLFEGWTGFPPKMWGDSIIGFGKYHYTSDRSKQEGDWPLVGFSPRKSALSLYVYSGCAGQEELLQTLGTYKMGKACIYVKKLSDINLEALHALVTSTIAFLRAKYP